MIALVVALALVGDGPPRLDSVFPPGGQAGTTAAWTLTGTGLDRVDGLRVVGGGVDVNEYRAEGPTRARAVVRIAPRAASGVREVRLDGLDGVSNLRLIRVDTIPQSLEREPNDDPARATPVAIGSAVAGTLGPTDVDYFLIQGTPGRVVQLDLEARRGESGPRSPRS